MAEEKKRKEYSGRQKAAIYLISRGVKRTAEIYMFLREDEIEDLTFEISRIDYVDPIESQKIIDEVKELLKTRRHINLGGIDFARESLEAALGSQKAIDIINHLTSSLQVRPFDFIRRTDPAHLLNNIQQEHPQTIALVLTYLEPNKSAVILQNLPYEIQSDVIRRIACMDRVSPEVLREVERVLEKKLSTLSAEDYTTAGGIENVVEILNLVDKSCEKQNIEALEDEDPELADEIKNRMFVFEDIVMLDDRAIQKVMREVDSQELGKALFLVDSEVQNKFFRNMSKRAVAMLTEDMTYMGPIRVKDAEEAQQKIVSIIRHLEDIGEIVVARTGEDELVAYDSNIVQQDFLNKQIDYDDIEINNLKIKDLAIASKVCEKLRNAIYFNIPWYKQILFLFYYHRKEDENYSMMLLEKISLKFNIKSSSTILNKNNTLEV